ncbi:hypothetical protein GCM10010326_04410 [Streptomyces xanthochromogenes]|uniref:Uncharacterized protein n=1 Tax=Streptomyces xanthochromogenes TaxID=67384 RepID=A0ABQ2ZK83_9ACTN|nr:hypothetical protein GCM10010326_04410 [Streptomyces xanthochromogenes]
MGRVVNMQCHLSAVRSRAINSPPNMAFRPSEWLPSFLSDGTVGATAGSLHVCRPSSLATLHRLPATKAVHRVPEQLSQHPSQ